HLIEELKKAEKYIFIESFIIDDGFMWMNILKILAYKAQHGVEVRVMYDDVGSFFLHAPTFPYKLRKLGIHCVVFNRFRPFFLVSQNNRDHRKIIVIDGKVAFTGGINIADEYINRRERFGYWKDSMVMMQGQAAWSLSVIFLQLWNVAQKTKEDFCDFYPWKEEKCPQVQDGYVQPFADSPTDSENVGEHVYLQVINNAKDYVYMESPYFIVDDSFISAMILAAKSGVDVRLIVPYKWDKFIVKQISKSYYHELISGGVRVYEYLPGFLHSKVFLADDKMAVVGSINLDYRSMYHHFECGTCLYKTESVKTIRHDFAKVLDECHEVSLDECSQNVFKRIGHAFLRLIAPLL
nr:cardiolipin synthase [Treponemataceae bacterium]